MKTKILIQSLIIAIALTSCKSPNYYQIYKAVPSEKIKITENQLVYEDDNCSVSYDLWDNGGTSGFKYFNKTETNIYLNLEETFFILNDVAYNYYKDRVYTESESNGTSSSKGVSAAKSVTGVNYFDLLQTNRTSTTNSIAVITSSGYSVSHNEEKTICIPAKTSKIINEYKIKQSIFRDCALLKYPSINNIKTLSFSKSNSPLTFSNRIEYKVGQLGNPIKIKNEFYVAEITNYPEREVLEFKNERYCEQVGVNTLEYFKNYSPDKFYIKYIKGADLWKH